MFGSPRQWKLRSPPPLADDVDKRARSLALNRHLNVVHRTVGGSVRVAAERIVDTVRRQIPSHHGEVDAPAERQRPVDADDLLVVRRIERVMSVKAKTDARVVLPAAAEQETGG